MRLNKWKKYVSLFITCLALPIILKAETSATGTVQTSTTPGAVLTGDYVVITNENFDDQVTQNTGAMTGGVSSSASKSEGDGQAETTETQPRNDIRIETQNTSQRSYTIGTTKVINNTTYEVIAISDHAYIWMKQDLKTQYEAAGKLAQAGQEMGEVYEGAPYTVLNEMSKGNMPYNDGTGKLSIIMEQLSNTGQFQYMADMTAVFVNAPAANDYTPGKLGGLAGLLAHEGQHALFANLINGGDVEHGGKFRWIDEGMAVAAMDYLWGGNDPTGWFSRIKDSTELRNGSTMLYGAGAYRGNAAQDYSIPYAFVRYLINQKSGGYDPLPFFQSIFELRTTDTNGNKLGNEQFIQAILDKNNITMTAKEAIRNFYIALSAQQPTGTYGFQGDPIVYNNIPGFPEYPFKEGENIALKGTASIVVPTKDGRFTVPSGAGADITFTAVKRAKNIFGLKGTGTRNDPYQINTAKDMSAMQQYPEANYKLMKDIDFRGQGQSAWQYIVSVFSGVLDGNGKTIKNVDKPLFRENTGIVKDVRVEAAFTGDHPNVVGVISNVNNGTIKDTFISGTVNIRMTGANPGPGGEQSFGAAAGWNQGFIEQVGTDIQLTIDMLSNNSYIGGLVGYNRGSILNAYSQGSVTVNQIHGGTADRPFKVYTGGLVGYWKRQFSPLGISNAYSTAQVDVQTGAATHQDKQTGRLVGFVESDVRTPVESTYALEGLTASGNTTDMVPATVSKSETDMKNQATYKKWNFSAIWEMPANGYPKHRGFGSGGGITAVFQKTQYYRGEELELSTRDKVSYQGSNIKMTKDMVSGFDSSQAGTIDVTVSYRGETAVVQFTIKDPGTVDSLTITSQPTKTRYVEGQTFNPEGLVLEAVKDGSKLKIYSTYTYDKTDPLTVADNQVIITYGNSTVTLPIAVEKPMAQSLTAITKPTASKTYYAGSTLDVSDLSLQITYNDGTKSPVFKSADFEKYNIQFVLVDASSEQVITLDEPLPIEANGKDLYACVGTPGRNAPKASVIKLKVVAGMYLPEQNIRMVTGKMNYKSTDQLSTYCNFALKSGTKPSWLTIPTTANDMLMLEGAPTDADVGTFTLVYAATAINTGQVIDIKLNISVERPSDKVELESFNLLKNAAAGLSEGVVGIISEDSQGSSTSVALTVPAGTTVTNLEPIWASKEGSEMRAGSGFENGRTFDFTNPVNYTFVPENGVNKTVLVTVKSAAPSLSGNANLSAINGIELKEAFNSNLLQYTAEIENSVDSLTGILQPVVSDTGKANFTIIGADSLKVGNNKVFIDVTAENGIVKRYTITVERKPYVPSGNASLRSISGITLDQTFHKDTKEYTASVSYEISELNITAQPEDLKATVTIQGNGNIEVGENIVNISVVAENGVVDSYTIVVTRQKSANAFLRSLSVDSHTLSPVFDKNVFEYAITVGDSVTTLLVEAEPEDIKASVVIDGADNLVTGRNDVNVIVTAQDGTRKTYTIHVTKETPSVQPSSNAFLQSISGVTLEPAFNRDTLEYTAQVANGVISLTIAAEPEDPAARVEVTGADSLVVGENTVTIKVTAQDGTVKIYTIRVTREAPSPQPSSNAFLRSISGVTLEPVFDKNRLEYTANVGNQVTSLSIVAVPEDSTARVEISGADNLAVGQNTIKIKVTAENGAIKEYIIKVNRAAETPAATIDYAKMKLRDLIPGAVYIIEGQEIGADSSGEISLKKEWGNREITIVKKGDEAGADSAGQKLTIKAIYSVIVNGQEVAISVEGEQVAVQAAPAATGYRFVKWTATGVNIDNPTKDTVIFTMGAQDAVLTTIYAIIITTKPEDMEYDGREEVSVHFNIPVAKFRYVEDKGRKLERDRDYTVKPGGPRVQGNIYTLASEGTEIVFKKSYLDTLKEKTNNIKAVFEDEPVDFVIQVENAPGTPVSYPDVQTGDWFYGAVNYVSAYGLMTGYADGNFGPADSLGRGQFATILYRMDGSPSVEYSSMFPDVPSGQFYSLPAIWGKTNDIITGYQNGNFGPSDTLTREQLVTMMYRYAQFKGLDISTKADLSGFPDVDKVAAFAGEPMKWAVGIGLVKGDQGMLNPQGISSRAVIATIIQRFQEKY